MSADEDEPVPRRRRLPRLGRGARIVGVAALLLLVASIVLWTERRPIAAGYVDRYLASKGVTARYEIADLGFGRQRLTNVVIGDPARPDLVADWIELGTDIGFSGASVTGVRAGQLRLRGRLVNGTLSLGALDRLMPPPSGKPFALPALNVDVADARMRLETPQGLVGLKASGRGRLNDGFAGDIAAVSDRLTAGGCAADQVAAAMALRITRAAPSLNGPVRAGSVTCGDARAAGVGIDLKVALGAALDRWTGEARLATQRVRHPLVQAVSAGGQVSFDGTASVTIGAFDLAARQFSGADIVSRQARIAGGYRIGSKQMVNARVELAGAAITRSRLAAVEGFGGLGSGTPVAPLAAQITRSLLDASRSFDGSIEMLWEDGRPLRSSGPVLRSATGVMANLDEIDIVYDFKGRKLRFEGRGAISGGGLPDLRIRLTQPRFGSSLAGVIELIRPFEADGASLSFTPLTFSATPRGNSRFATRVTLSGPLGDGRVERLDVPLDGIWNERGRLALNPDCTAVGWRALAVSGLRLRPATLRLCPISGALVQLDGGRLSGGARIAAPRLAGTLGSTPVTLAAAGSELRLGDMGFALNGLAVRIGSPERVTRLDFAGLTGRAAGRSVAGQFTGGGGQIGNVPLLLSDAAGDWGLNGGRLILGGAMRVSDAAADPRFRPLNVAGVRLALADNQIRVGGKLVTPAGDVAISDVSIIHDLASAAGSADLAVPGIAFADKGLQPDDLTRLTVGVITNVVGTVSGEGHIRWNPQAVTSDGVFRTDNVDLAAALGPVMGIATEIRFTDLLNLQSAAGQVARIKTINTGIVVNDGVIRYQTLPAARVQVESGEWPFAGGRLVLEPTLLDFSEAQQRRMTLTVTGMEAAKFLQQFEFDNLDATGVFDGRMPMVFEAEGGRIVDGRLTVRPGGGTIAYLGEVSKENLGVWGNLAFQALRSLRYRSLDMVMNGPLSGEMVTEVRFAGVGQGEGAKRNFILDRLQRLPFIFNLRIKAPFRGLFDSARSFYDPSRLIERNLPALMQERDRQNGLPAPRPVQPQESETVR